MPSLGPYLERQVELGQGELDASGVSSELRQCAGRVSFLVGIHAPLFQVRK